MARQDKKPKTFEDHEFNQEFEEALRQDQELLERLAKTWRDLDDSSARQTLL